MVRGTQRDLWSARPASKIFAVERLVAVEAKVGKWAEALKQAVLNTWFASESYLLLPRMTNGELSKAASERGIGIWSQDKGPEWLGLPALEEANLPRSYGSWLFNEWAWRRALGNRFEAWEQLEQPIRTWNFQVSLIELALDENDRGVGAAAVGVEFGVADEHDTLTVKHITSQLIRVTNVRK